MASLIIVGARGGTSFTLAPRSFGHEQTQGHCKQLYSSCRRVMQSAQKNWL